MDRLVEIDRSMLPHLKDIYVANGSQTYGTFMIIANFLRWFERQPNTENVKFYCLNGDFSDGSFIATDQFFVYADTTDESSDKLFRLLQLFEYSKSYIFSNIRSEIYRTISDALQMANVEITDANKEILVYRLLKKEALKFDVRPPDRVELRPLTEIHDLEKINSMWTHGNDQSLPLLQRWAKFNATVGAFKEDGTLMAWIFHLQNGMMGVLQTDPKYTDRGYGALVTKCLSKNVAEMGFDVHVEIIESNKASKSLFEKLGFKAIGNVGWIKTKER